MSGYVYASTQNYCARKHSLHIYYLFWDTTRQDIINRGHWNDVFFKHSVSMHDINQQKSKNGSVGV